MTLLALIVASWIGMSVVLALAFGAVVGAVGRQDARALAPVAGSATPAGAPAPSGAAAVIPGQRRSPAAQAPAPALQP